MSKSDFLPLLQKEWERKKSLICELLYVKASIVEYFNTKSLDLTMTCELVSLCFQNNKTIFCWWSVCFYTRKNGHVSHLSFGCFCDTLSKTEMSAL